MTIGRVHVLDRPWRKATLTHLLIDEPMNVLRRELGQPYPSERRQDVDSNELLVAAPRHRPRPLLGDFVQPTVQVFRHRESLVDNWPALSNVTLDLPQAIGDPAPRLA